MKIGYRSRFRITGRECGIGICGYEIWSGRKSAELTDSENRSLAACLTCATLRRPLFLRSIDRDLGPVAVAVRIVIRRRLICPSRHRHARHRERHRLLLETNTRRQEDARAVTAALTCRACIRRQTDARPRANDRCAVQWTVIGVVHGDLDGHAPGVCTN